MPRNPINPLTEAERRVAELVVQGKMDDDIAAALALSKHTVRGHVRMIRNKLGCLPRCSRPVLAHALLYTGEVRAPEPVREAPDFTPDQLRLLNAVATQTGIYEIGLAARIAPADVRALVDVLVHEAQVGDVTQLVTAAYGWRLLDRPLAGQPG
jgi:DNA-binding CsgD family transcriptional regulator